MSRPGVSRVIFVGFAAFLISGIALAQAFGRVVLIVTDEEGNPLKGVKVTATTESISTYEQVKQTDKKGKVTLQFVDATQVYNLHFEYAGYPPSDVPLKPQLNTTITREVTLGKGAAQQGGLGMPPPVFSAAEEVYNEGVRAMQADDLETALEKFEAAADKNPKLAAAHAAVASVYCGKEMWAECLAATDRLVELEPDNPRAYHLRHRAYAGLGDDAAADQALDKLKSLDSGADTVAMIYNDGVEALKQGDVPYAKGRFLEALEMDPNLVAALAVMSTILNREKSYQEALAMADRVLALEANHERALRSRWEAYSGLGETEKAQEALQDLAKVSPDVLAVELYNQGAELFENGQTEAALARFEEILSILPDHALAHYRAGICYVGSSNTEKAREHLSRFIELSPDHPEASTAKDMLAYLK